MAVQVGAAWEQMLSIATQQGFTREQIMVLTMRTARQILLATSDALWGDAVTGDQDYPVREIEAGTLFRDRIRDLARTGDTLTRHFGLDTEIDPEAQGAGE